jgi:hypothetical protein
MEITRRIHTQRRNVATCVMLLCPYKSVERAIKDALTESNLSYKYPDASSSFFIDDKDLSAEVYISQPVPTEDKFYVEIVRYGGDGFIVPNILFRITNYYDQFFRNSDIDEEYKAYIKDMLDMYMPLEEIIPINDEHASYSYI